MNYIDEYNLIRQCQSGNKAAFQELIIRYYNPIYRFLLKLSRDEDISLDLTQETFLKMVRNIDKFQTTGKTQFSTYLFTIAKNSFYDYLRKSKCRLNNELDEDIDMLHIIPFTEDIIIDRLDFEESIKSINTLPKEQQLVIKMRFLDNMSLREIEETIGIEAKTIKSRVHNGMVKLRKNMERWNSSE
jgi:RNA polymerase sigma-70 factor (ECF subfamily)